MTFHFISFVPLFMRSIGTPLSSTLTEDITPVSFLFLFSSFTFLHSHSPLFPSFLLPRIHSTNDPPLPPYYFEIINVFLKTTQEPLFPIFITFRNHQLRDNNKKNVKDFLPQLYDERWVDILRPRSRQHWIQQPRKNHCHRQIQHKPSLV